MMGLGRTTLIRRFPLNQPNSNLNFFDPFARLFREDVGASFKVLFD